VKCSGMNEAVLYGLL